ncbi:MAG: hypothetical protein A2V67_14925, partial [Deltaproteobacteria bacterium RBG_13_61_14]
MKRNRALLAVLGVALMVATAFLIGSDRSQAVWDAGVFELDGNIHDDGGTLPTDWDALFSAAGAELPFPAGSGGIDSAFVKDFVVGASGPDNSYHEPSNKDGDPIDGDGDGIKEPGDWGCVSASNPTDKTNILNAYAAAFNPSSGNKAGHLLLYFAVERYDNSGDANVGFWFFQNDVSCDPASGAFLGSKTIGDILVVSAFTNGGSISTLDVYQWQAGFGKGGTPGLNPTPIVTGVDCSSAPSGASVCAKVNSGVVVAPWPSEDKIGPDKDNSANALDTSELFEGGLDITSLVGNTCFGSFMAETRSSQELSATDKDFALGDMNTCDASITIGDSDANEVGTPHTFTVHVEKNPGTGSVPAQGVVPVVTFPDGAPGSVNDSDCDAGTDASGNCDVVVNSDVAGSFTAHACVDISIGSTTIHRCTDGTGSNSGDATKVYADARIAISPLTYDNEVGTDHVLTITLEKSVVAGVWTPLNGETVTASITNSDGATAAFVGSNSCVTNASGQCTVTINSPTAGSTTVEATWAGG